MKTHLCSRVTGSVRLATLCAVLLLCAALSPAGAQVVINFDNLPVGPNNFAAAGPMQVIDVPGVATVSGGVVLGNPSFLPAFPGHGSAPNLYGTTDFADPSLLDTITLTLPASTNIKNVSGVLFNGQTISEDYSINAFFGATNVGSLALPAIQDNSSASAFRNFSLTASGGNIITSLTITTPNAGLNGWNFFVDNLTVTSVPEPSSFMLLASMAAVAGIGSGLRWLCVRRK